MSVFHEGANWSSIMVNRRREELELKIMNRIGPIRNISELDIFELQNLARTAGVFATEDPTPDAQA